MQHSQLCSGMTGVAAFRKFARYLGIPDSCQFSRFRNPAPAGFSVSGGRQFLVACRRTNPVNILVSSDPFALEAVVSPSSFQQRAVLQSHHPPGRSEPVQCAPPASALISAGYSRDRELQSGVRSRDGNHAGNAPVAGLAANRINGVSDAPEFELVGAGVDADC